MDISHLILGWENYGTEYVDYSDREVKDCYRKPVERSISKRVESTVVAPLQVVKESVGVVPTNLYDSELVLAGVDLPACLQPISVDKTEIDQKVESAVSPLLPFVEENNNEGLSDSALSDTGTDPISDSYLDVSDSESVEESTVFENDVDNHLLHQITDSMKKLNFDMRMRQSNSEFSYSRTTLPHLLKSNQSSIVESKRALQDIAKVSHYRKEARIAIGLEIKELAREMRRNSSYNMTAQFKLWKADHTLLTAREKDLAKWNLCSLFSQLALPGKNREEVTESVRQYLVGDSRIEHAVAPLSEDSFEERFFYRNSQREAGTPLATDSLTAGLQSEGIAERIDARLNRPSFTERLAEIEAQLDRLEGADVGKLAEEGHEHIRTTLRSTILD